MTSTEISQKLKQDEDFQLLNIKQLASKYNCSTATINRAIRKADLKKQVNMLLERKYTPKSKKPIEISNELHEIITASLLGDGYITPYRRVVGKSKARNKNSSLIIKHGEKQKDYVDYKSNLINKHIKSYIRKHNRFDERFQNPNYVMYSIETTQNIVFNTYRDTWYKSKKEIPFDTFTLTPLIIAIWFMDDGSKTTSGYVFSTNCFSLEEVIKLSDRLLHFNIKTNITQAGNNYIIYVRSESVDSFNKLILPHMCDSMLYKIHFKQENTKSALNSVNLGKTSSGQP
jgi:hypothetical protein